MHAIMKAVFLCGVHWGPASITEITGVSWEEVGVKWPPIYMDVGPEAEDRPLLEEVTKQCSEDRDGEH
jgi:hypothetical protein